MRKLRFADAQAARIDLHDVDVRVAPIDVGFDLRLHDTVVTVPDGCGQATYADRAGERWYVEGTAAEIVAELQAHGYATDHDDERDAVETPFVLSATAARSIRSLRGDFGDVDDYFLDTEIDDARREAWDCAREAWEDAISALLEAASLHEAQAALETASRIESEWGDDPLTQRIVKIALRHVGAK